MRRRLIIIAIALAVLSIPAIVIVLIVNKNPKLQNTILKVANVNQTVNTNVTVNTNTTTARDKDHDAIVFTSKNFAERFGSVSNQNNFANYTDAEVYTTDSFKEALQRSVDVQKQSLSTTPFTSTTTKALTFTLSDQTANSASVVVTTQRHETIDRTERTYYQDLILNLLLVGKDWRVNAASWKVS